jgi:hypothetical protein
MTRYPPFRAAGSATGTTDYQSAKGAMELTRIILDAWARCGVRDVPVRIEELHRTRRDGKRLRCPQVLHCVRVGLVNGMPQ